MHVGAKRRNSLWILLMPNTVNYKRTSQTVRLAVMSRPVGKKVKRVFFSFSWVCQTPALSELNIFNHNRSLGLLYGICNCKTAIRKNYCCSGNLSLVSDWNYLKDKFIGRNALAASRCPEERCLLSPDLNFLVPNILCM